MVVTDTLITEEHKKTAEYKALMKRIERDKKKAEMTARLPKVLEFASTTFGKDFKTLKAFSNFVAKMAGKKAGKGKRAKKLTEEQAKKLEELVKAGKNVKELMKETGCSKAQANKFLYPAK